MAGDRVRCATCKHQANSFCLVKKCKVAINKRRKCNQFVIEPGKVKLKKELPSTRGISRHLIKDVKKDYKRKVKEDAIKKQLQEKRDAQKYADVLHTGHAKHPLTGDLSRFTSTAGKE